jgi:hypothetical protein
MENKMKVVVLPGFSELIVKVSPSKEITREGLIYSGMPWLYAPWRDSISSGIINVEVEGNTLKDLLNTLATLYKKSGVDFDPVIDKRNDVDSDYTVLINGKNYAYLPSKLDTLLKTDDEVKIKLIWRWDG